MARHIRRRPFALASKYLASKHKATQEDARPRGSGRKAMFDWLGRGMVAGVVALIALLSCDVAIALDKVRLGRAVPNSFAFAATEVGIEAKIFEKEGIEVEVTSFRGDAQLQQALAAGSLDVGLGSGPGLGFRAKGATAIGVAAMFGAPANLALVLPFDTSV